MNTHMGWLRITSAVVASVLLLALALVLLVYPIVRSVVAFEAYDRGVDALERKDYGLAITQFSRAIQVDSTSFMAYFNRGNAYYQIGAYDEAIADYDMAISLKRHSDAYCFRGMCYAKKGQVDRAIMDYTNAILLNPELAACSYNERGLAHQERKDYSLAVEDFLESIRLDSANCFYRRGDHHNNLAWLSATCPDVSIRNGNRAVEHATKACELTDWKDPMRLGTLAAAYAERGEFDQAVLWQKRALEVASPGKKAEKARLALALYEKNQPYREGCQ